MTRIVLTIISFIIIFSACHKAGEGGDASLQGYVQAQKWNSTFTQYIGEYPAKDVYVYIVYGDRSAGYDTRVKTDYNGRYLFPYLYKGHYKVYAYSRDSTFQDASGIAPVIREVDIVNRKETITIDTMTIFQ